MKDPKPNPNMESAQNGTPEAEKPLLPKVGETVKAIGWKGKIEDGWTVKQISVKGDVAVLTKEGLTRKKYMNTKEYQEWNPELFPQPVAAAPEAEPEIETTTPTEAETAPVVAPQEAATVPIEREAKNYELVGDYGSVSRAATKESHENNEDSVLEQPEDGLFGVFDGMGGVAGGERASRLTKEVIEKSPKTDPRYLNVEAASRELRGLLENANRAVLEEQKKNPGLKKMGSTASLVKLVAEGDKRFAVIATVGDSPVYIVRKDSRLECVGIDNEMLKVEAMLSGKFDGMSVEEVDREIAASDARIANIKTPEDYKGLQDHEKGAFAARNMLTGTPIGSEQLRPLIRQVAVELGDRILIASDGITDNLTRERIAEIVANRHFKASESCDVLADEARVIADQLRSPEYKKFKQTGEDFPGRNIRAKDDDMSAIVVEVGGEEKTREVPPSAKLKPESRFDFWRPGAEAKAEAEAEAAPIVENPINVPAPEQAPATAPEAEAEQVAEKKDKLTILDEAREAYVKAHREYQEGRKGRPASMYDIGGDISATTEARAAYDAALKAASLEEQQKFLEGKYSAVSEMSPKERMEMNNTLFDKFVVDERRKMTALKLAELPEKEQSWYKRAWMAYSSMPRWKKIALSTAIGTGVAVGSGAIAGWGIVYYAGKRIVISGKLAPMISKATGAVTTLGYEAYDSTLGRKKTKDYKIKSLRAERGQDIPESLDDLQFEYSDILEKDADREKKRMYLKIAIAAAAGAGAVGFAAHHIPSGAEAADGHHGLTDINAKTGAGTTPGLHSAEAVPVPKVLEHAPIEVHKGDSLWEITAKELQKNPDFDKLNDAEKTWTISTMVDRAVAHKDALHIANPDSLAIGQKIDLSSILKDGDVHSLVEKAGHLTAAQQEHILANNHEISAWLHAHPHEQLTTARVEEILHPHGTGNVPDHGDITTEQPPDLDNSIPLHHLEEFKVTPQHVEVGHIAEQIHQMPYNPDNGQQVIRHLDSMNQIPPMEMRQLMLIAAERAGDHHPIVVNIGVMEMHHRMQDYLVSYPRAQGFGFHSYDHWARVRDVPVHRFAEDTTISPRPEALQSALRHSFFHPGAKVHEMQGGALRSVPLEERHANLGMAIRGNSDLVRSAPRNMTVGQFVAAHHGAIGRK